MVLDTHDLSGRVALVVGAGSKGGIGFAVAEAMAAAGAVVAIADLPASDLAGVAAALPAGRNSAHGVDVADPASVESLVRAVVARHGRIDVLVNAAAILVTAPVLEVRPEDWQRTFAVNTHGTFYLAQAVARVMRDGGRGGRIILVASNVGKVPRVNNIAYAASKAAVIHTARAMAMELGRHGITVNALCPGSTATTMLVDNQAKGDPSRLDGIIRGSVEQWRTGIPLGHLADPADQAAVCVFLASEGGRYVSGQAIFVDGAQTYFGG